MEAPAGALSAPGGVVLVGSGGGACGLGGGVLVVWGGGVLWVRFFHHHHRAPARRTSRMTRFEDIFIFNVFVGMGNLTCSDSCRMVVSSLVFIPSNIIHHHCEFSFFILPSYPVHKYHHGIVFSLAVRTNNIVN